MVEVERSSDIRIHDFVPVLRWEQWLVRIAELLVNSRPATKIRRIDLFVAPQVIVPANAQNLASFIVNVDRNSLVLELQNQRRGVHHTKSSCSVFTKIREIDEQNRLLLIKAQIITSTAGSAIALRRGTKTVCQQVEL